MLYQMRISEIWMGGPERAARPIYRNLLPHSTSYNFAVVNKGMKDERANGEFWGYYNILEYKPKYHCAAKIQVFNANGNGFTTDDFVLFNNFKKYGNA